MLLRMYCRYAEANGFKVEILDHTVVSMSLTNQEFLSLREALFSRKKASTIYGGYSSAIVVSGAIEEACVRAEIK